jgi:PRC-barrel domain
MTASKIFLCAILLASPMSGAIQAANASNQLQPQPGRPPLTTTVPHNAESVLGKRLIGASGETLGRIVDVLADETGQVRAVIVDYGGFLGIGSRRIAVSWQDLRFSPGGDPGAVAVDVSSDRLASAPAVKPGKPVLAISARDNRFHIGPGWRRSARD